MFLSFLYCVHYPIEESFVYVCCPGTLGQAKRILNQVDRSYYKCLFGSFPMEKEEDEALLVKVAADYEDVLGLVGKPMDDTEIAMQLLGLVSFADFEDKKKLIVLDNSAFADRESVLKRLKR
jgi:TPP-dependent trihydroxycyclohexane-1,2-dione (THcHDO) dehydratase